jgi:diadenosine tetraphosphate (Ap4A) HIT family hydrolase
LFQSGGVMPGQGNNALMESPQPPRLPVDAARYVQRSREGPCFVCAILAGHPDYPHHDVYEDAATIGFLARRPTLLGYCIVAPRRHVEDWVRDMGEEEYLAVQRVVHRVAGAVASVVPVERMYCLSLGSQQGNAHLHWHIAPLPPGVPYDRQQYYALMAEHGVLDVGDKVQADLARAIRSRL